MANENPTGSTGEQGKKTQGQETQEAKQQGAAKEPAEQRQRGAEQREQPGRGLLRRELAPFGGFMALSPFSLMRRMMDDLDRIFEDYGPARGTARGGREMQRGGPFGVEAFMPQIDVIEREGRLVVRADLPGIRKENLDVQIMEDALVLQGERRQEVEEERGGMFHSERSYGSFRRAIPLPQGADVEHAEARFDNGVLEIVIPLSQQPSRGRRIEIQEGKQGKLVH